MVARSAPDDGNKRKIIGIGLMVVLALVAAALIYRNLTGSPGTGVPTSGYYYDLDSGDLFTARLNEEMVVPTRSGNKQPDGSESGVRAHVFACGRCSDTAGRKTGYLETYTAEGRAAMAASNKMEGGGGDVVVPPGSTVRDLDAKAEAGHLFAKPEKPVHWMPDGPESEALVMAAKNMCEGKPATECYP